MNNQKLPKLEVLHAALVLMAAKPGSKQVVIPADILAQAEQHIEAGNTLGIGPSKFNEKEIVIGWLYRLPLPANKQASLPEDELDIPF